MLPPSWDNFFTWFHPLLIGQSILMVFVLPHLLTFKFEGFFFLTNCCSIHTDLHVFLEHPNMSLSQGFSNSSLLCLECSSCRNPQCLLFLSFSSLLPYHFITFFSRKATGRFLNYPHLSPTNPVSICPPYITSLPPKHRSPSSITYLFIFFFPQRNVSSVRTGTLFYTL